MHEMTIKTSGLLSGVSQKTKKYYSQKWDNTISSELLTLKVYDIHAIDPLYCVEEVNKQWSY